MKKHFQIFIEMVIINNEESNRWSIPEVTTHDCKINQLMEIQILSDPFEVHFFISHTNKPILVADCVNSKESFNRSCSPHLKFISSDSSAIKPIQSD